MTDLPPEYAIRIDCPFCNVKAGQPCVDLLGNQREFVHDYRKMIYTKQVMNAVDEGIREIEAKIEQAEKMEKSELYGSW